MALSVKINNVDKTNLIDWKSFQVVEVLTKEADIFTFSLKGKSYKPELSDEVEIFDGTTKIYGGYVIEVEDRIGGGLMNVVEVTCKDYTHILDRLLVFKSYPKGRTTNLYAEDIVKDIIQNFTSGFTTNNVKALVKIESIAFNYDQVSKALQMIAQQIDYDWYVDQNKDVHFFSKEENLAPFELNDDGGNFVWGSLVLQKNVSQIKNSIYIRGGDKTESKDWIQKVADGKQRIFNVGYSYNADVSFEVEKSTDGGVNWTPLSEGRDGVDNPNSFDVLYNPNKAIIIFREDNKPADGDIVRWRGNITYPIIIHQKDDISVNKYGEFQFRELDKSIKSLEEARQRALSILTKYADKVNEGNFMTYQSGLKVGQKIKINSAIRGIDEWFTITKMITRIKNPQTGERRYDVNIVGSETMGIIDVLTKLLVTDPNKNIAISADEIVDLIRVVREDILITESVTATIPRTVSEAISLSENVRKDPFGAGVAPTWVLGPYTPTGDNDPKRPILCDRGGWVY